MRLLILLSIMLGLGERACAKTPPVSVPNGVYQPLFGAAGEKLEVKAFLIDRDSVSNGEFSRFLEKNPAWRKGRVSSDFADRNYLAHWKRAGQGTKPERGDENRPVTFVSWFAASAYCEWKGGRLPSTLEWEYVAAASRDKRDAGDDPKFREKVLLWYTTRTPEPASAAAQEPNYYGIRGLHGAIWEWTSDFNAFFVAADNRQDGDQSRNFFCGGAATGAAARESYPAFMRYALRSSLQANYSLNNLGFRCAYDNEK